MGKGKRGLARGEDDARTRTAAARSKTMPIGSLLLNDAVRSTAGSASPLAEEAPRAFVEKAAMLSSVTEPAAPKPRRSGSLALRFSRTKSIAAANPTPRTERPLMTKSG